MTPIFLVHISEFLFKIQTVAGLFPIIHHHCRRVLLSLSSMISKSHFSLYLLSKLIDIWFLLFLCLISLSFSISSFFFAWFCLSFCSFPSNRSPDESDLANRRTETNGFDRPFGRQEVRNLFTQLEWVEWWFDPKPNSPDPWMTLVLGVFLTFFRFGGILIIFGFRGYFGHF